MNISHNKFQTPIELHRKLGNKYQVELYERMMKKKMVIIYKVVVTHAVCHVIANSCY